MYGESHTSNANSMPNYPSEIKHDTNNTYCVNYFRAYKHDKKKTITIRQLNYMNLVAQWFYFFGIERAESGDSITIFEFYSIKVCLRDRLKVNR